MYVQADYFQIESLKARAEKCFSSSFLKDCRLGNAWRMPFEEAIEETYNSTPESDKRIRKMVIKLCVTNMTRLRGGGGQSILTDEFLKRLPAFAADLSISLLNKYHP